jgi:hypothetical protein
VLIALQDILHVGNKVCIVLRGNHPTFVSVRLEDVVFLVCRTVSFICDRRYYVERNELVSKQR